MLCLFYFLKYVFLISEKQYVYSNYVLSCINHAQGLGGGYNAVNIFILRDNAFLCCLSSKYLQVYILVAHEHF